MISRDTDVAVGLLVVVGLVLGLLLALQTAGCAPVLPAPQPAVTDRRRSP